jgi:uncharacterized membrane protein
MKVWILGGTAAALLVALVATPGDLLDKLFFVNSGICPQRPGHTYFFGNDQMPLEARMVGIFAGFIVTVFLLWFVGRGRALRWSEKPLFIAQCALVGVMALDGLNATLYDLGVLRLYTPQNWLRITTGTLSGIGMGCLLIPAFSVTIWKYGLDAPSVKNWREMGLLLLPGIIIIGGTISGWSVFFWLLSLVATIGVIGMLAVFNLIIVTIVLRRENRLETATQFLTPLALVVLFSLGELLLFATLRVNLGITPL